tara:strand:+ start:477 stop:986 length:510 start_codon:yes stop_codon:yes gene_type:complete
MGTCELCGAEGNPTRQAIASNVNVDACARCIESMGLELFESPFHKTSKQSKFTPHENISRSHGRTQIVSEGMSLVQDFHVRIRNERVSRGWEQKDLAMRMNERLNVIQRIENGSRPTDILVTKIEKVLGIILLEESRVDIEAQLNRGGGRRLTIADALEDYLSKEESDD